MEFEKYQDEDVTNGIMKILISPHDSIGGGGKDEQMHRTRYKKK
jgi:hypothetical protein